MFSCGFPAFIFCQPSGGQASQNMTEQVSVRTSLLPAAKRRRLRGKEEVESRVGRNKSRSPPITPIARSSDNAKTSGDPSQSWTFPKGPFEKTKTKKKRISQPKKRTLNELQYHSVDTKEDSPEIITTAVRPSVVSPDYDKLYRPNRSGVVSLKEDLKIEDRSCNSFFSDDLLTRLNTRLQSIQQSITDEFTELRLNDETMDNSTLAQRILSEYGDDKIMEFLEHNNIDDFEMESTPDERALQMIEYMQKKGDTSQNKDMKEAVLYLGGILEYMTESVLAHAGYLAKENDSVTPHICESYSNTDTTEQSNSKWIIRPHHIKDVMHDDTELYWWQRTVSQTSDAFKHISDESELNQTHIVTRLGADSVRHILGYFESDISMLVQLGRVDRTFYVLCGTKRFWVKLVKRCYIWNASANPETTDDLRALIASDAFLKYAIGTERWIQNRDYYRLAHNNIGYILFSRLNPSFNFLSFIESSIIKRESSSSSSTDTISITEAIHDGLHQIMEIFGPKNGYFNIAKLVDNSRIIGVGSVVKMLQKSGDNGSRIGDELVNIEGANSRMVKMALSASCNPTVDSNIDQHWLYIGSRVVIRKVVENTTDV